MVSIQVSINTLQSENTDYFSFFETWAINYIRWRNHRNSVKVTIRVCFALQEIKFFGLEAVLLWHKKNLYLISINRCF